MNSSDVGNQSAIAIKIAEEWEVLARNQKELVHKLLKLVDKAIALAVTLNDEKATLARNERETSGIANYLNKQVKSLEMSLEKQKRETSDIISSLQEKVETQEATIAKTKSNGPEFLDSFECSATGLSIKGNEESLICYLQYSFLASFDCPQQFDIIFKHEEKEIARLIRDKNAFETAICSITSTPSQLSSGIQLCQPVIDYPRVAPSMHFKCDLRLDVSNAHWNFDPQNFGRLPSALLKDFLKCTNEKELEEITLTLCLDCAQLLSLQNAFQGNLSLDYNQELTQLAKSRQ